MSRRLLVAIVLIINVMAFHLYGVNVNDYRFHSMPETSYYAGIHSIVKDKIGRIWFSGSDAVYMYDGVSFERQNDKLVSSSPDTWWTFLQVVMAADGTFTSGKLFAAVVREDVQPYTDGLYINAGEVEA